MRLIRALTLILAVFLSFAGGFDAAAGEWGWPKLFSQSSSTGTTRQASSTSSSGFKIWNPFKSSGRPNMLTRAGSTTKRMFTSTASFLTPWNKPKSAPLMGTRRANSWHNQKTKTDQSWSLFSWMRPKPEPKLPQTVTEWMDLPRQDP